MKKTSILLLGFLALFPACETDFEINAPWKEITIVYGLLNQQDTVHYIKINKAFLGAEDAFVMALVPDSSQYNTSDIKVTIQQIGGAEKVYVLDTTLITNKIDGDFYSPQQIVYQFIEPNLNDNSDYELTITNKKTGKVVTATTPIIDGFIISIPTVIQPFISFYFNDDYQTQQVTWNTAKDGKRYQLTIRFNYDEQDLTTLNTTAKYVDWVFSADKAKHLKGGVEIKKEVGGEEFYNFLASKISVDNNVERYAGTLDFIIDVAGEELNTYMEVNGPSTGIVQEKPEYTNIKNDKREDEIGIFSCRYQTTPLSKPLIAESKAWLQDPSSPTAGLGFQ